MQLIEHPTSAPSAVVAAFREDLVEAGSGCLADAASMSDAERIELIAELERLKSGAAAAQARLTTAYAIAQGLPFAPYPPDPADLRPIGSQVALARHESPAHGDDHVRLALLLTGSLPRTMRALELGRISEWTATLIVREAAALDAHQRHELDERLAPDLPRLSSRGARTAARRIVAEIDAEAVRRRMDRARQGRRVSMRVVGDGMAYLSILAPTTEVAGAHASLKQHALSVVAGASVGESTTGRDGRVRGVGAIMSDIALERLTGRAATEAQPVAVNIVMTDRSLLRWGEQSRSSEEPALIPGLGPIPADFVRELLTDPEVEAFYRRLFTSPDGRDLVAADSRSRCFPKGLRSMITLRDQRCRTPFCDAPIAEIDHIRPHREGGPASYRNGMGLCRRCNLTKESPGFRASVHDPPGSGGRAGPHAVTITTPAGQSETSVAPPLLGWGWRAPPDESHHDGESPGERRLRLSLAA
ncbi:MAG: DUF222 domain-containing protein [Intrasporangiaceae bacterium]|nr:DUF222 domain-containing protein [Intrasporangiaceae bacterium]